MAAPRELDFFFFIGSIYSTLSVLRIEPLAAAAGVRVRWRPFNVRAIMVEQDNIPRKNPVKMKYLRRDVERRARLHGIACKSGFPHPVDPDLLANRVAALAAAEGWCAAYARAVFGSWFAEHTVPGEPAQLARTLRSLGKDADAVLARADSAGIRQALEAETDAARKLGVFGAPTFMAGDEMFWGDDRLEDALHWASGMQ